MTCMSWVYKMHTFTYQLLWVPNPQKLPLAHVFLHQSHWRMCWNCHHRPPGFCQMASGRLAEYHVPGSTIPNMHCQSALQLGPHGWRYTHAGTHKYFIHVTAALLTTTPRLLSFLSIRCTKIKIPAQLVKQYILEIWPISGFTKVKFPIFGFVYCCNRTRHCRFHYSNPVTGSFPLVTCMTELRLTSRAPTRHVWNKNLL